ncbi:MAG: hypothetical protein LCH87_14770 [Actinobacteria bacterium]|nr:hypothetical protein [Actinomycetota bacterium]
MQETNHHWVQAAPFRALVLWLVELTGLPWAVLAEQAEVPPAVVHRLLHGRGGRRPARIPRDCAARLLALDGHALTHLARQRR